MLWLLQLCEGRRLFSFHRAHVPAAHATSHIFLLSPSSLFLALHHESNGSVPVSRGKFKATVMPIQNRMAYRHVKKMWSLVSISEALHSTHPFCTSHPLPVRTYWVRILLSSINQRRIRTFIGTFNFQRTWWWVEITPCCPLFCMPMRRWRVPRASISSLPDQPL